ncbi:MAG TPA: hypothetical protein VFD38_12975 [Myxococcaceae bacterium]|nr:hypothetical protein [Myxococcaceae bacterium]
MSTIGVRLPSRPNPRVHFLVLTLLVAGCSPGPTRFADVVHAGELFVSGAGMGALERASSSGTPLLVLLGDQPEQARNVAELLRRVPDAGGRPTLVAHPRPAF